MLSPYGLWDLIPNATGGRAEDAALCDVAKMEGLLPVIGAKFGAKFGLNPA